MDCIAQVENILYLDHKSLYVEHGVGYWLSFVLGNNVRTYFIIWCHALTLC